MKSFILIIISLFLLNVIGAQTVMQLDGPDCKGNNHDLLAELDSGKAVILFFFMPNCSSCPPPAQRIQKMANNLMATYPNSITGYALPYNNTTSCSATSSWVTSSNVPFYAPYDSGATMVANYGGFGMPTVVVLGGKGSNRRVLFSTLNFVTSDTAIIRDSIKSIIVPKATSGLNPVKTKTLSSLQVDPIQNVLKFECTVVKNKTVKVSIIDMMGKVWTSTSFGNSAITGLQEISIRAIPTGNYIVRMETDDWYESTQFNISR